MLSYCWAWQGPGARQQVVADGGEPLRAHLRPLTPACAVEEEGLMAALPCQLRRSGWGGHGADTAMAGLSSTARQTESRING